MTTETLTVTEFLLARIDEDEEYAREVAGDEAHQEWAFTKSGDYNDGYMVDQALKVLRNRAAQRKIIALHTGEHECVGVKHGRMDTVLVAPGYMFESDPTLGLLACVYADHEDFNPDWLPEAT